MTAGEAVQNEFPGPEADLTASGRAPPTGRLRYCRGRADRLRDYASVYLALAKRLLDAGHDVEILTARPETPGQADGGRQSNCGYH